MAKKKHKKRKRPVRMAQAVQRPSGLAKKGEDRPLLHRLASFSFLTALLRGHFGELNPIARHASNAGGFLLIGRGLHLLSTTIVPEPFAHGVETLEQYVYIGTLVYFGFALFAHFAMSSVESFLSFVLNSLLPYLEKIVPRFRALFGKHESNRTSQLDNKTEGTLQK